MRWAAGAAVAAIGLGALLVGLLPPHVLETGQLDPRAWVWPIVIGAIVLLMLLRWILAGWRPGIMGIALLALILPPVVVCVAGSLGRDRVSVWLDGRPIGQPQARKRVVGVLSGPMLHIVDNRGGIAGVAVQPLWQVLSQRFQLKPLDVLDASSMGNMDSLLVIQPRALSPDEMVALDAWVRMGKRAVLLVDTDLHWADGRPLGHPLRAPQDSRLHPLLAHWGLFLGRDGKAVENAVERRFLDSGRMIQVFGAAQFSTRGKGCVLTSGKVIAHCSIGRGEAVLVADADFANDALWTTRAEQPGEMLHWTSDAVPALADWIDPGSGTAWGRRVWLTHADGLPQALRPALVVLLLLSFMVSLFGGKRRNRHGFPT